MAGGARICLGQIGAAHGVRGEVRAALVHRGSAGDHQLRSARNRGRRACFEIEALRPAKDHFVATLAGIADRDAAERLTNIKLYVPRERLPEPEEPDEFYHADLVGLAVVDPRRPALGTVVAVHNFGAGDLIELRRAAGGRRELLPFNAATVPTVDIAAGRSSWSLPEDCSERRQGELGLMWRASVLTIFPEMFPGPLGVSLAGKALAAGAWALDVVDIRNFATDRHRSVDDTPAGGGPGMVMKADVLARAIDAQAADANASDKRPRLLLSPRGAPLDQGG